MVRQEEHVQSNDKYSSQNKLGLKQVWTDTSMSFPRYNTTTQALLLIYIYIYIYIYHP